MEHLADQWFVRDPSVCGGQPVVRGTRVPVRTLLESLADGDSFDIVLREFPTISADALRAVVAFAAASAAEDLPARVELPTAS